MKEGGNILKPSVRVTRFHVSSVRMGLNLLNPCVVGGIEAVDDCRTHI